MASLPLTPQDLHMLSVVFGEAHRQGRLTDDQYHRTVVIVAGARLRMRQEPALAEAGAR